MSRAAEIVEVAGFVGVIGGTLPDCAAPFDLGELSGPQPRRLARPGVEVIYVPRHAGDAPAPVEGEVALVWGRAFRDDDTRLVAGDAEERLDAARLDGKFTLGRIGARHVELHTDRIGAGSCYHCKQAGRVYFATHLGALLAVLPQRPGFNDLGIAELIFFGAQLFDESPYSGIYRLPAGRMLALEGPDEGARISSRNMPAFSAFELVGREAPDYTAEAVLAMADLGVSRERFGAEDALLLSAGRDSLLLALSEGAPRNAIVYGQHYTIDRVGGQRRARQLGMNLLPFARRDWDLTTYQPLIARLFGGVVGLNVTRAIIGTHGLRRCPLVVASGNFGGSTLLGSRHFDPEPMSPLKAAKFQTQNSDDQIAGELFAEERAHIMATLEAQYDDYVRQSSPEVAVRLMSWQAIESRRFSVGKDALDWFAPLANPYFNRGFMTLVANARPEPMADRRISNAAIAGRLARYPMPLRYRLVRTYRLAKLRSRMSRARAVGQVYWPPVVAATPITPDDLTCGHARLDEYMRRSWEKRFQRPGSVPPKFMFPAGIVATAREFGI